MSPRTARPDGFVVAGIERGPFWNGREVLRAVAQEEFISTLANHALVEIRCDHDAKTDTPVCNCAVVALGAHPNVQAAKEAWAAHVWEALDA